jgi:hypothetical protein
MSAATASVRINEVGGVDELKKPLSINKPSLKPSGIN